MSVTVITPPDEEPISLEEAKEYLHAVDYDDQDEVIERLIKAARLKIERRCARSIVSQELEFTIGGFAAEIELPRPPVSGVTSVTYLDRDGDEQTLDPAAYVLIQDEFFPYLIPLSPWPTDVARRPDAVKIRYVSGDEPSDVPDDLKQAMYLLIGAGFELRQQEVLTPTRQEIMLIGDGAPELIAPYIVPRL